jgi:hypothetical protein
MANIASFAETDLNRNAHRLRGLANLLPGSVVNGNAFFFFFQPERVLDLTRHVLSSFDGFGLGHLFSAFHSRFILLGAFSFQLLYLHTQKKQELTSRPDRSYQLLYHLNKNRIQKKMTPMNLFQKPTLLSLSKTCG